MEGIMSKEEHFRKLEHMMHSAPIVALMGARAMISDGHAKITIDIKNDFFHAAGALHGAVYFLALDNAAFFAVNSRVEDVFVLTKSFEVKFIRPVSSGSIKALGRVTNESGKEFIAESVLYNSDNEVIARGSGSFVRGKTNLTPEIGYKY